MPFLNLDKESEYVMVSAGAITPNKSRVVIDSSEDTTNLTTISGGGVGDVLVLRAATSDRVITVKSGAGIHLKNGDVVLDSPYKTLRLIHTGTGWSELGTCELMGLITSETDAVVSVEWVNDTSSHAVGTTSFSQDIRLNMSAGYLTQPVTVYLGTSDGELANKEIRFNVGSTDGATQSAMVSQVNSSSITLEVLDVSPGAEVGNTQAHTATLSPIPYSGMHIWDFTATTGTDLYTTYGSGGWQDGDRYYGGTYINNPPDQVYWQHTDSNRPGNVNQWRSLYLTLYGTVNPNTTIKGICVLLDIELGHQSNRLILRNGTTEYEEQGALQNGVQWYEFWDTVPHGTKLSFYAEVADEAFNGHAYAYKFIVYFDGPDPWA